MAIDYLAQEVSLLRHVWAQRVPATPYRGDSSKRYGCRQDHTGRCRYIVFKHGDRITMKCMKRNAYIAMQESLP